MARAKSDEKQEDVVKKENDDITRVLKFLDLVIAESGRRNLEDGAKQLKSDLQEKYA